MELVYHTRGNRIYLIRHVENKYPPLIYTYIQMQPYIGRIFCNDHIRCDVYATWFPVCIFFTRYLCS